MAGEELPSPPVNMEADTGGKTPLPPPTTGTPTPPSYPPPPIQYHHHDVDDEEDDDEEEMDSSSSPRQPSPLPPQPPPPPSAAAASRVLRVRYGEPSGLTDSDCSTLIDVKILSITSAEDICRGVGVKLGLSEGDIRRLNMVVVYTTRENDGTLTHVLHTLKDDEKPYPLLECILDKTRFGGLTREQMIQENLVKWYLKDDRSPPLELQGYVSGSSASEEEEQSSWNDLSHISQNFYEGYLLKRSSKDPNLWRRRWCILDEDKIWYAKAKHRKAQGKVASISLVSNQVTENPSIPFGIDIHTAHRQYQFRADTKQAQMSWINLIRRRIDMSSDNDLICMAELMICDEELARAKRLTQAIDQFWTSAGICCAALEGEGRGGIGGGARSSSTSTGSLRGRYSPMGSPVVGDGMLPPNAGKHHALLNRGGGMAEGLAFAVAVQEFRELCRHDLSISSEKRWEFAQRIFDEFLRSKALSMGGGTSEGLSGGGSSYNKFFRLSHKAVSAVDTKLLEYGALIREGKQARPTTGDSKTSTDQELSSRVPNVDGPGGNAYDRPDPLPPPPRTLFDEILKEMTETSSL